MRRTIDILPVCLSLFLLSVPALADTVTLKDGRTFEGFVTKDRADSIDLDVGSGILKFSKKDIRSIDRSDVTASEHLRGRWDKKKQQDARREEEFEKEPKVVPVSLEDSGSVYVKVVLNDRVAATMMVDTGAGQMLITRRVAEALGLNVARLPVGEGQVADGRMAKMAFARLNSVRVENSEARDVGVSILLQDSPNFVFGDGLLGMSYLKRFNFSINQTEKKLTLQKLDAS